MTPTHRDSPLRRSEIGAFRNPVQNRNSVFINDDEEERRQARRRTIIENSTTSIRLEDNETLKNCLKIYSENKLSKDNAWSLSLIDTLSTLLQSHHKSLNNFKVAGSSLEASSKVYGLRVDSIHTDVLRMSAGLNKQKIHEEIIEQHESNANEHNNENNDGETHNNEEIARPKPKRTRKAVSTITKNKETINTRLDTVPLTDPIFGKFNAIAGNINSSNRLLQNILVSDNSELMLRLEHKFWDSSEVPDLTVFDEANYTTCKSESCGTLANMEFENLILRPNHTGYIISDKPEKREEDKNEKTQIEPERSERHDQTQLSVAFDINAESEPIHMESYAVMDVDLGDVDDLTVDEQLAINNCKGLRRAPIIIEDMRPTDSLSNLEYSYRPLDKISRFWAGPSHWKFKKLRNSSIHQTSQNASAEQVGKHQELKGRSKSIRFRPKQMNFGEPHDDLFQKLEEKNKIRKANIQRKWDGKKLKLPTDLQIDKDVFDIFRYAPGLIVREKNFNISMEDNDEILPYDEDHLDDQEVIVDTQEDGCYGFNEFNNSNHNVDENWDHTVVEIASEFAGAPDKVTKIIVPFAKRAKVVDMKQLKKCCMQLITNQFTDTDRTTVMPESKDEKYVHGIASFREIYLRLPKVLTHNMAESLSPSVAFYSILHLANDFNLRIVPQEDLKDFKIRQLLTE